MGETGGTDPDLRQGVLSRRSLAWATLLFAAVSAFYVATMAPGLMPGDTGDMVIAAATLREAHPPGYPLYGLLGKFFLALPLGDIPFRANLMAACCGGLSVALFFLSLLLLTRGAIVSLAGSLLVAFHTLFWTYFAVAEAFCLNNLCLALTLFLALLWREHHRACPRGSKARRILVLLAFVAGLAMGNHHTIALTYPGLLLFVALTDRTALRPARLAALVGWFAFGIALAYLYLPVAALAYHDHHWEDTGTLEGLLRLFLRDKYGTFQLDTRPPAAVTMASQASRYLLHLGGQLLWVGVLIGLAGGILLWRRDRPLLGYTGGAFALGVLFLMRANIDPARTAFDAAILQRFYMLPTLFFLVWVAVGLAALATRLPNARAGITLVLPLLLLVGNAPKASQRGNWLAPRFYENILASLPRDAILLAETDEAAFGLDYLLTVERRRPDVIFLHQGLLGTEPYMTTARRIYPHLAWPEGTSRRGSGLDRFLAANLPRHRVFTDDRPRHTQLPTWRHGLLWEVGLPGNAPDAAEWVRENERLWNQYDLRQVDTRRFPPDSMCYAIVVFSYLQPRFHLAREYIQLGYYAQARAHLDACARMDGENLLAQSPDWHREKGHAALGLEEVDEAIQHLERARALDPSDSQAESLLLEARRRQQHTAPAPPP